MGKAKNTIKAAKANIKTQSRGKPQKPEQSQGHVADAYVRRTTTPSDLAWGQDNEE
ncbi:hypothetical protein [Streptomyces halstedii]|uniref:Uncharacterized protein n=1 Tax=Streptomyces halstedii TaxID=1944 RepID=A0A6N9U427_STRHA|nr:hypothetical protein [Streptomyces halstedii]NEA16676.1 hypothetical protein [Streptomyces halstedii]